MRQIIIYNIISIQKSKFLIFKACQSEKRWDGKCGFVSCWFVVSQTFDHRSHGRVTSVRINRSPPFHYSTCVSYASRSESSRPKISFNLSNLLSNVVFPSPNKFVKFFYNSTTDRDPRSGVPCCTVLIDWTKNRLERLSISCRGCLWGSPMLIS